MAENYYRVTFKGGPNILLLLLLLEMSLLILEKVQRNCILFVYIDCIKQMINPIINSLPISHQTQFSKYMATLVNEYVVKS